MSKRKIFFIQEDNMEVTEAFRTVRTNLAFQNDKEIGRKIMVTSSIPGEGKSTLAGDYGASLAIAGKKVLLIDCDIRRPRAHESFGIKVERGLESVLTENVNPKDVIIKDLIPNFDLLPTKHMRYNVTELFIGDKMKEVISSLENEYNTIILDMPPLAVASDAAILSKYVDGVVVVVAYDQVAKRELEFTKEMLSNAGANIYGFVVTKVDKGGLSYGNYGYYNNYYSYYQEYYSDSNGNRKKHTVKKPKSKFGKFIHDIKEQYKRQFSGDLKGKK